MPTFSGQLPTFIIVKLGRKWAKKWPKFAKSLVSHRIKKYEQIVNKTAEPRKYPAENPQILT